MFESKLRVSGNLGQNKPNNDVWLENDSNNTYQIVIQMYCCVIEYLPCEEGVLKKCNCKNILFCIIITILHSRDIVLSIKDIIVVFGHVNS